jgi:hypothetical protein
MAKHNLMIGIQDEHGATVGTQCARCHQIVLFENGRVPEYILKQECHTKREDVNQAAARVVRAVTEKD